MSKVTQLLDAAAAGDPEAASALFPLVYEELRALAAAKMASEAVGHTLDATGLVHEAYLKLVGRGSEPREYADRGQFFAAAAAAMRRILIDNARRKQAAKRGGGAARVPLDDLSTTAPDEELLALNEALEKLAAVDPEKAQLVELRYFGGLTGEQAASVLGVSPATADRYWAYARAWLRAEVRGG